MGSDASSVYDLPSSEGQVGSDASRSVNDMSGEDREMYSDAFNIER